MSDLESLARRIVEQNQKARDGILQRNQRLVEAMQNGEEFAPIINEFIEDIAADGGSEEDGEVLGPEGTAGT